MEDQIPENLTFDFHNAKPRIVREDRDQLRLRLGEFAGPLDLLLYLIRREQANIFDIPIARITQEYLTYIQMMKNLDISIAGDFLVMAATLIEIKSKMLLPRDIEAIENEEAEDPRKELADRLIEYEKFKAAAQMLYERTTIEQAVFQRGQIESDENNAEVNVTVFDLITVFQKILARHVDEIKMEIEREEVTLADMLIRLQEKLNFAKSLNLRVFFEEMRSKRELVTAFMAVLEIVRTEGVRLVQSITFGDILLKTA